MRESSCWGQRWSFTQLLMRYYGSNCVTTGNSPPEPLTKGVIFNSRGNEGRSTKREDIRVYGPVPILLETRKSSVFKSGDFVAKREWFRVTPHQSEN
ncbi:hypothetical protein AFLA_007924 [Aspergillus flavus NRRL3357]|nr:hypothetical protein AFLA_007924 [Aspergillus flavus NRRL3357]